jgi:SnoaL-like domain
VDLERFCDAWFAAWTGTDADRLAAYYAEDCFYSDPGKPEGIRGRDALSRYLRRLLAANPKLVWTRRALYPVPGGFAVTYDASIPLPTGETIVERGMDLVLLDAQGKIVRNEVYFDMARWRAALTARAA